MSSKYSIKREDKLSIYHTCGWIFSTNDLLITTPSSLLYNGSFQLCQFTFHFRCLAVPIHELGVLTEVVEELKTRRIVASAECSQFTHTTPLSSPEFLMIRPWRGPYTLLRQPTFEHGDWLANCIAVPRSPLMEPLPGRHLRTPRMPYDGTFKICGEIFYHSLLGV